MPNNKEKKDANTKKVTVGGKEKLLLMDDDETNIDGSTISEVELQETISKLVAEALEEVLEEMKTTK